MDRAPHLSFSGDHARAHAVVLLLHGGAPDSFASVSAYDPAFLRMLPFGRSVLRAGGGRIIVARLRYAHRGWNGDQESPLADARWALDRVVERFGELPLGLVGHSMGGRVALRVVDHEAVSNGAPQSGGADAQGDHRWGVRSVAALAPWLPDGEPIPVLGDRALLLAHGTADHTTDPARTTELAEKLTANGRDVTFLMYPGARHSMIFPARPWHDLVAGFMVRTLLSPGPKGASDNLRH